MNLSYYRKHREAIIIVSWMTALAYPVITLTIIGILLNHRLL